MVARKTAVQKSTAKATKAASAKKSASAGKATSAAAQDEKATKVTKKAAARTATAKKSAAKKTSKTTKSTVKKATAKKTASAAPAKKAVPAKKTGARKVVAKKTPGGAPTAKQTAPSFPPSGVPKARVAGGPVDPAELPVRPGEDPWSAEEVDEARAELLTEAGRLRTEILASEQAITGLMRDSGDGAGDDQADTGTKNITREHEMALAGNAREMLLQTERALERLDAGTYGLCENCGNAIGKARMQAFSRATLCVECKQRQERR
ncbi:TraR/DksA family transcriptional regulator [Streptomyces botrytidirepellens]|uniref:TraR/DksA family transcriptional regulator n=1 Tax=Streptomyces botrytidirepellens TaxID=2486417 RepID=A0A3M8TKQ8_9ACTN|nr:TraR/DksA family transcriptional regulator [Streptomyces botrytidirepellens]RNF94099.1 TraR/DksA family transcriptional regulator [Streptomyces botrytidirepellens]